MEKVSEHFSGRLNDLDDSCVRDTKKIKTIYANDQNKETKRAKSSLTLTSYNTEARDQKMILEVMDNDLSTTTNTDLEDQRVPIQTHGYADHNSGTIDIKIENQVSQVGSEVKNKSKNNDRMETESTGTVESDDN
ncbi:33260_t:CDS:2 [Gigaspora margarita]|uniref:33260_t:CDS:1 n=1 Tax=Gigaspora margarita TaxID=4874 RepID=A0ABN7VAP8_GIGMA|nr:33260_t:CDS:2 [Gigaspora margarita]